MHLLFFYDKYNSFVYYFNYYIMKKENLKSLVAEHTQTVRVAVLKKHSKIFG